MSDEGVYNEKGFVFYEHFIDALLKRGIQQFQLISFEMPAFLYEKYNGFYSRKVVDIFVELCKRLLIVIMIKLKIGLFLMNKMEFYRKGQKCFLGQFVRMELILKRLIIKLCIIL